MGSGGIAPRILNLDSRSSHISLTAVA
jgi:hypothetical protein